MREDIYTPQGGVGDWPRGECCFYRISTDDLGPGSFKSKQEGAGKRQACGKGGGGFMFNLRFSREIRALISIAVIDRYRKCTCE